MDWEMRERITITAIIPARLGSRRLKRKNFLPFCGRTLTDWTVICALKCSLIDKVIVSTDNPDYFFEQADVIVDRRDPEMCGYDVHTDDICKYVIEKYELEGSKILLQPSSPLRPPELLTEALEVHLRENKSVVSVYASNWNPNGLYYIFTGDTIYDKETIPIVTPLETGIDIDHLYQFKIAEFLFKRFGMIERLRL